MFLRYLRIFGVQLKNNFVREAVYRTNFFAMVAVDLIWFGLEFGLFSILYANTPTVAGWTQYQVFFFLGVFFASDALFTIFFQRNFWVFSDLVNKGELDILLTKPINPLFLILTRSINLTASFNLILGILVAVKFAGLAGFAGGWRWGLLVLWLLFGLYAAVLLRFLFSIWVFWTERSWAFARLYYQFFSFATKPDAIYPPPIRYAILTILPFAFIGSVPARALLKGLQPFEYAVLSAVLVFFTILLRFLWRAGLRRYQSASS